MSALTYNLSFSYDPTSRPEINSRYGRCEWTGNYNGKSLGRQWMISPLSHKVLQSNGFAYNDCTVATADLLVGDTRLKWKYEKFSHHVSDGDNVLYGGVGDMAKVCSELVQKYNTDANKVSFENGVVTLTKNVKGFVPVTVTKVTGTDDPGPGSDVPPPDDDNIGMDDVVISLTTDDTW